MSPLNDRFTNNAADAAAEVLRDLLAVLANRFHDYTARINRGRGTWPQPGYVRGDEWHGLLGSFRECKSAILAVLRLLCGEQHVHQVLTGKREWPADDGTLGKLIYQYTCNVVDGDAAISFEASSDEEALARAGAWVREDDWMWDPGTTEITVFVEIKNLDSNVHKQVHPIVVQRPKDL